MGIPEFLLHPNSCVYGIDSAMAVHSAQQAGFEGGIKPWQVSFHWCGGAINNYVWGITNYLTEFSGHCLLIDSNSGDVLEKNNWTSTP